MTNAHAVHCSQHTHHVGVCPACQRARLAAEKQQLAEAQAVRADVHPAPTALRPPRNTV